MRIGPSPNAGLISCAVVSSAVSSNAFAGLNKAAISIEDVNATEIIMRFLIFNNNSPQALLNQHFNLNS